MEISSGVRTLTLRRRSRSRAARPTPSEVVWAEIAHDGHVGRGEGAPDDRYGESVEAARAFIDERGRRARRRSRSRSRRSRRGCARAAARSSAAARSNARCTISSASSSVSRRGGCSGSPTARRETSYTIGIDSIEGTADRARRAAEAGYRRLKVKLGGAADLERLRGDPRASATCRCGSTPTRAGRSRGARRCCRRSSGSDVELIEQPFPAGERDAFRELRAAGSGIPLVVDEGCHTLRDVADVASYADGVNLKLAKTGGIREAVRMIHAARALGLVVMLGCMIESSLGISAAAQFASLCDFVDLDGHLLISDDPVRGARPRGRAHRALAASRAWAWSRERERARRDLRRGVPAHVERQGRPRPDPLRRARGRRGRRLAARRAHGRTRSSRTPRKPVPIVATVAEAAALGAQCLAIGVAPAGGKLPPEWKAGAARGARARAARRGRAARRARPRPDLVAAAAAAGARAARPARVAGGPLDAERRGARRGCAIVHTVGSDCAIGKMTVTLELTAAARGRRAARGLRAHRADRHRDRRLGHRRRPRDRRLRLRRGRAARARGRGARRPAASSRARARSCTRSTRASRSACCTAARRTRSCSCTRPAPIASISRIATARPAPSSRRSPSSRAAAAADVARCDPRPSRRSRSRPVGSRATTRPARRSRRSSARPGSPATIRCASAPSGCGVPSRGSSHDRSAPRPLRRPDLRVLARDRGLAPPVHPDAERGRAARGRSRARGLAPRCARERGDGRRRGRESDLLRYGSDDQVAYLDAATREKVERFDRWLFIWASATPPSSRASPASATPPCARARRPLHRAARRSARPRASCSWLGAGYPTALGAQTARMGTAAWERFVYARPAARRARSGGGLARAGRAQRAPDRAARRRAASCASPGRAPTCA